MAQARVTDFFTSRKRNLDIQPSKRRKVLLEDAVRSETTNASNGKRNRSRTTARSSTRLKATTCESALSNLKANSKQSLHSTALISSVVDSPVEESVTIKSSKSTCKELISTEQFKTSDISPPAEKRDAVVLGDNKVIINKDGFPTIFERKTESLSTAACDDHSCSPLCTPTKRKAGNKTIKGSVKRSRVTNTVARDLLSRLDSEVVAPEKGFNFKPFTQPQAEKVDRDDLGVESFLASPRKKLQPHRRSTESSDGGSSTRKIQSSPCKFIFRGSVSPKVLETGKAKTAECTPLEVSQVTDCLLSSATKDDKSTKQVILTRKDTTTECTSHDSETDDPSLSLATKETKSRKQEPRLDATSFKEKLKGCGQLSQLKEKLAEFGRAAQATRKTQKQPKLSSPVKIETDNTESAKNAPAYERFHSLAAPVPPSLTLPYHYKVLDEMFRGVDTVVSMLHQRSELCTFNKLKTAVQLTVRRTFDLKNLGRIKTVYPKAYTFRQENGLPCFGGRTAGYQLTVEANLEDKQKDASEVKVKSEKNTETKRQNFSAAELLARKTTFHKGLIEIVKKHHREFLSNLERPLSVPDHKITRWHPKFQCDEVPAVDPSPLPLPPDTATFGTAKDALEQARNKFTPRVQKALEIVAAASAKKESTYVAKKKTAQSNDVSNKTSSSNTLQGVPQSLLERIRAKEEKKLENEMTRTPAQSKHIDAISRLPELVRILRTFFVTQKKVALPVDDVVQKLSDSYRTSLGKAESERHLKLMVELLPDWIQMVTVKKGRFIKIDKNLDVQRIYAKLQTLLKEST